MTDICKLHHHAYKMVFQASKTCYFNWFSCFHIHLVLILINFQNDALMHNLNGKKKAFLCVFKS